MIERRFATEFRETSSDEPGLVLEDDGTVNVVELGGTRTALPSTGGSPPVTIRNVFTGNAVLIADAARGFPTWDRQSVGDEPSPWLDITNAMEPSIVVDGLYAFSVTVAAPSGNPPDGISVNGGFFLALLLDSESTEGATTTNAQGAKEIGGEAVATVSTTWYMQAGAQVLVQVDSRDGAEARNFYLAEAVIQKL